MEINFFSCEIIEGFEAWAPKLARLNSGEFFHPEDFKKLVAFEDANFWYLSRNQLILWAMNHYFVKPERYAEIGCGTGFVLKAVQLAFPESIILGTDLFVEGLKYATQRCPRVKLVQMDARAIPYRNEFNVVGIFDVLEHIENDKMVLEQISDSLVPGGGLLITVPQHKWLWSSVDEADCHVRRYSAQELENKVSNAGFEILRSTSFVSLLLPMMAVARLLRPKASSEVVQELNISRVSNWCFGKIMAVEFNLIRLGIDFMLGGSRLLIARKKFIDPL